MSSLSRVRVVGPLEPYMDGFRAELATQGYSLWTATALLQLTAHLSSWLADHDLGPGALTGERVEGFLRDRRASGQVRRLTPRGLMPLLGYLRRLGVAPAPAPSVAHTPLARLLEEFSSYLISERGLAPRTVCYYRGFAELFLSARPSAPDTDRVGVETLRAGEVTAFLLAQCPRRSVGSANNVATALRALLRFLYVQGYTATPLAGAVPTAARPPASSTSRALQAAQVNRLLASCDRDTAAGRRDYAILVLLVRLGLRAGEVAALGVDDVDWRTGQIGVAGKGRRYEHLPLPVDVGEALADYCHQGRRRGGCRSLFLHVRAPYTGLSSSAVSGVVARACARAGLPQVGAHQLRHTAACAMLDAGAPLAEIGQVLRHRQAATTARYARVSRDALGALARRWPGGGA